MSASALRFIHETGGALCTLLLPVLLPIAVGLALVPLFVLLRHLLGPWPLSVQAWVRARVSGLDLPRCRVVVVDGSAPTAGRYHPGPDAIALDADTALTCDYIELRAAVLLIAQARLAAIWGGAARLLQLPRPIALHLGQLRTTLLLVNFLYGARLLNTAARAVLDVELCFLSAATVAALITAIAGARSLRGDTTGRPAQRTCLKLLTLLSVDGAALRLVGLGLLAQRFDEVTRAIDGWARFVPAPPLAGGQRSVLLVLCVWILLAALGSLIALLRAVTASTDLARSWAFFKGFGLALLWELPLAWLLWRTWNQPLGERFALSVGLAVHATVHLIALIVAPTIVLALTLLGLVLVAIFRRGRAPAQPEPAAPLSPDEPWMAVPPLSERLQPLRALWTLPLLVLLVQYLR